MELNVDTAMSPQFIFNGVINFHFELQKTSSNSHCNIFVRFQKKRQNDILDYSITLEWDNVNMIFETLEERYLLGSRIWLRNAETISVKVDLKTLSSPCASLYEDTELTDFKLVGDDGYVLLHKAIAAAYSPFFKTMFCGQWKETTEGIIEVSDISKQTLEHFKEYMYLGTFPNTCVKQLLLLSKFYMMEDLENRCLFKLRAELTKENIFEIMEFAVANKQRRLLYEALDAAKQDDINMNELEESLKTV